MCLISTEYYHSSFSYSSHFLPINQMGYFLLVILRRCSRVVLPVLLIFHDVLLVLFFVSSNCRRHLSCWGPLYTNVRYNFYGVMLKEYCSIWCCENNAFKQRYSDNHLLGSNNLNPIDGPAAPNCTAHIILWTKKMVQFLIVRPKIGQFQDSDRISSKF